MKSPSQTERPPASRLELAHFCACTVCGLVIGWIDYITGPEISVLLLYLALLGWAGWRLRLSLAAAETAVVAGLWIAVNLVLFPLAHPVEPQVRAWNAVMVTGSFMAFALLTNRLRRRYMEQRIAVTSLRASEQRLRDAIESFPGGFTLYDAQDRLVLCNSKIRDFLPHLGDVLVPGTSLEDIVRAGIARATGLSGRELEARTAESMQGLRTERAVEYEVDGRWVRALRSNIPGGGRINVSLDVTEFKRLETELRSNQQMLEAVFDAVPERLFVKDRQGRFVKVNRAQAEAFHLTQAEFRGLTTEELGRRIGGDQEMVQREDAKVYETGQPLETPDMRRAVAGGQRWYRVIKVPLRDAAGEVVGIVGLGIDVTARRQMEDALRESEQLLRSMLDVLPISLSMKDLNGRFLKVNQALADTYGLALDQMTGKSWEELAPLVNLDIPTERRRDAQVIDQGSRVDIPEAVVTLRSGQQRWYRTIKLPLRDAGGAIVGIVTMGLDVTESKEAEEDRIAMERLMQRTQSLEGLGAMAGGIAHHFNNLLQRIMGFAEVALLELPESSPARQSVQMIESAGQSAVELTRQMLALSGRSHFAMEQVDLNELAESVATQIKRQIQAKTTLRVQLSGDTPKVRADVPLLRQVIHSLVVNASEAMGKAGGEILLATGASWIDRGALNDTFSDRDLEGGLYGFLEVRDNGPGLAADVKSRLYEPFFSTKFGGKGLGLAAVRGIVHGHLGAVQVDSAPGAGSVFRILLPSVRERRAS